MWNTTLGAYRRMRSSNSLHSGSSVSRLVDTVFSLHQWRAHIARKIRYARDGS